MKRLALLLATALTAGLMSTPHATTVAHADEPAAGRSVMTLNVHGGLDTNGGGNAGAPAAVLADILTLVERHHPDVIALQELCHRQHRAIRRALRALGYEAAFTTAHRSKGCHDKAHGNRAGVGLYVRGDIAGRASWSLPWGASDVGDRGRQPRRILCARVSGWDERVCATHLSPSDPDKARQVAKVGRILARWDHVILAGDLNMSAGRVATDLPGYSAAGGRIDHVVASSPVELVAIEDAPSSDHDAVLVEVSR